MSDYRPTFDLSSVPEKDRSRVAAMIPHPAIGEAYVHRMVRGVLDFDLLDDAVEEQENVILAGPTGSSKTTLFRAYASARGLPFVVIECNAAMDPGVIIGRTSIGPDGSVEFVDGDLTLIVRYGGVALIDEINMAHPRVTAAWHGLLSVMRSMTIPENGEVVKAGAGGLGAPQDCLFGAAYNPRYQGTVRLNEALGNRFPMPFKWDYDRDVENQLVDSPRLIDMAYNLRSLAEIRTPVSTNMLMEFQRHAHKRGTDMAEYFFLNHFASDEEGPVSRALDANSAAIAAELGLG
jgi:MoxR-like ATPase